MGRGDGRALIAAASAQRALAAAQKESLYRTLHVVGLPLWRGAHSDFGEWADSYWSSGGV